MKQRNNLIFTTLVVISIICIILTNYNKNDVLIENKKTKNYYTDSISMNFETEAGSGIYEEVKNSDWPLKGYKFNNLLSKCKNGSEIIWDSVNKRIQVSSITSDKCYVYFDKVILPSVKVSSTNGSASAITVNVAGTKGTYNIAKYMYSIDNKKTWITKTTSATTSNNTFSSLASNTEYTIYIKIVDVENNESEISTKVSTGITGAQKIKNLYTSQGANGIYYHNSSLTNGAKDNSYRYSGANPNNWMCFGTTATTCDDEHLYRIIGVFNNQIKLIKSTHATSELLGSDGAFFNSPGLNYFYYWTYSGNNSWKNSNLNSINLNTNYLNTIGNTWSNKISINTWYVGGISENNGIYSNAFTAYNNEVGSSKNTTSPYEPYSAKVGLMYISDYYYAASSNYWTYLGYDRSEKGNDYSAAVNANWMALKEYEWTISPETSNGTYAAIVVCSDGFVSTRSMCTNSANCRASVRPTFYLNSNVEITSGTGTKTNPYRVA